MSIFKSRNPQRSEPETIRETDEPGTQRSDVPPDDQLVDRGPSAEDRPGGMTRVAEEEHGAPDAGRTAERGDVLAEDRPQEQATQNGAEAARRAGNVGTAAPGTEAVRSTEPATEPAGSTSPAPTGGGAAQPERLVPRERADAYSARWDAVKSGFVDDPRQAVTQADALVGELLDELQQLFTHQRRSLEEGLDSDTTSTEDLRLALGRYRSFFDRLVAY